MTSSRASLVAWAANVLLWTLLFADTLAGLGSITAVFRLRVPDEGVLEP
jgi:hypothetical protein